MRKKVALLTNIIAPYRVPIYAELARHFDLTCYVGGQEDNRSSWDGSEKKLLDNGVKIKSSWGFTFLIRNRLGKKVYDFHYLHLRPGYFWNLIVDRPDAVITNEIGFRTLSALLYGMLFHKPIWIWWGGTLHTESKRGPLRRALRRLVALWVRRWISYGLTSTEYLLSLGVHREHVLQIQNCVDETLYDHSADPVLHLEPRPALLYTGQLIGRKGVKLLLEAAVQLQQSGHSFTLLIVGNGPERDALETYAQTLGLVNVHFYPAQPPEAMPAIYRSADCLVFPTLEDVWGLVVNEALWSGIPVLSSIYAGCTQEIVPTENRFDPLKPQDFDRILRLALEGHAAPPDPSKLRTCKEVGDMIIEDIRKVLKL